MMPDYLAYALLAALSLAAIAGPLGALVVWQRLAFFGDTLAHGALLGVALGILAAWPLVLTIVAVCLGFALLLSFLLGSRQLPEEALLGIVSQSALALGLVAVSLAGSSVDVYAYLFGDLLTTSAEEAWTLAACALAVAIVLAICWQPLLRWVVNPILAQVEGLPVRLLRLLLLALVAITVALAMRVVGVLLVTALLVIPACASRRLSSSPESMAFLASLLGALAVLLGLSVSYYADTPAGPSIVLAASVTFALSLLCKPRV
jgi:zinc transport system permease protein